MPAGTQSNLLGLPISEQETLRLLEAWIVNGMRGLTLEQWGAAEKVVLW